MAGVLNCSSGEKVHAGADAGYVPSSRRPIAQLFRRTAVAPAGWCVRLGIHPNQVSYASLAASTLAAVCFLQAKPMPFLLLAGAALCYVRLWLNMLDGMVALASGKASRGGEIVNELPDRFSDIIIFIGVGHSGLCHPAGGYWVAIFALLTAYVGTLGQAIGVQREFSGWMSKPWRMVALHAGISMALGARWFGNGWASPGGLTILDWTHLAIVLGCVQTICVRLIRISCALR
jgi:phosphatidylglycerophosphate synthase